MKYSCLKCSWPLEPEGLKMETKEGLLVLCSRCCAQLVKTQLEKFPHRTEYVWEWVDQKRKPHDRI